MISSAKAAEFSPAGMIKAGDQGAALRSFKKVARIKGDFLMLKKARQYVKDLK